MTEPLFQPGTVSRPNSGLEHRVAELENRLAEFMRRDLSNAGMGLGSRLRVRYGSGAQAMLIGTDVDGKPKIVIQDPSGNVLLATDSDIGYGLASPIVSIPAYITEPNQSFTQSATFVEILRGRFSAQNPAVEVTYTLSASYGSFAPAVQGAAYWSLTDSVTGWSYSSPVTTGGTWSSVSTNLVQPIGPQAVLLPSTEIGRALDFVVYCRMVAGGSGSSVGAVPRNTAGASWARYHEITGL